MSESPTFNLSGPSLIPESETSQERTITRAIILLHGFGSDGQDLLGLVPLLEQSLPKEEQRKTAYFSPNGPLELPFGGYAWFDDAGWTFRDRKGIERAKNALWQYMEEQIFPLGLKAENVILFGFSQGSMTSFFSVPRFPQKIKALIAHSGRMMWDEELANESNYHTPPMLLLHGKEDDVVNADESVEANERLQALGFETELHLINNLQHGINEESIEHAINFLLQQV